MILKQSNKPCKLKKDTEPKLPDVTTESCIHRVDCRLMGEGAIITTVQPIFLGECRVRSEKAMAPHSSTLAWKIPWTEEPGRLRSMGSQRVRHDWATSLSLFTLMPWRRKWQPTPVFLPGESQGRGSLVGCRLWGHTELDMTETT